VVDGLGCDEQMRCEAQGSLTENQKLSCQSLVLANETQGTPDLDWGDVIREGYTKVDGLGGRE
jgi:hypothetical protein